MSNEECFEVTVTIKEDETKLSQDFLEYESLFISHNDARLRAMVEETKAKFKGELKDPDIMIKIKFPW